MNRRSLNFIVITILILSIMNCGPPKTGEETSDCYPTDVQIDVNSEKLDVSWVDDCQRTKTGYNIYISDESNVNNSSSEPHNTAPYAGDTNPEDGVVHYVAERLENGKKYYVGVEILYPNRTKSKMSTEKVVVCGPRGEMELSIRYKSEQDGFSFEKNSYVRADKSENDLCFFSKDDKDFLDSPTRLDSFLKGNKLKKLNSKGDLAKVAAELKGANLPDKERVEVKKGDWIWIYTPDKKTALVNILDISGNGENRKIKLYFAYSPMAQEYIF